MNWPNELESLSLASLSRLVKCNTPAYWIGSIHSLQRKQSVVDPVLGAILPLKIIVTYTDFVMVKETSVTYLIKTAIEATQALTAWHF